MAECVAVHGDNDGLTKEGPGARKIRRPLFRVSNFLVPKK